jgi:ribose transport system substrate-binding protein
VEQKVDGIAVSCINPEIMGAAIDRAIDQGIHVVTWDSDAPNSKREAFYGIDDTATGKLLGEELAALLPEGGKVAILSGVQGAQNLADRVAGGKEALASNPKIEMLDVYYCNDDLAESAQIIADVMTQHPDLAGWLMVGGWPLFTSNGLDAITPGKTKVVSVDPLPAAQRWITDGYVQVCVGQKVFGWGEETVKLLHTLATGGTIETEGGFVVSGRYADAKYTALEDYKRQFEAAEAGTP